MKKEILGLAFAMAVHQSHAAMTATLPNQPIVEASSEAERGFDHGAYSVHQVPLSALDIDEAKAYDNFTLSTAHTVDAIAWSGIFAEPIPSPGANVDFLVEIWQDDNNAPKLTTPAHSFFLSKGPAGESGGVVSVSTPDTGAHVSPLTETTPGGGPAFSYDAPLPTTVIPKGDYWISIQAVQNFNSPLAVDPEWQWHVGMGPGDGFFAADRTLEPATWPLGSLVEDRDLAFTLFGDVLPLDCNLDGVVDNLDLQCGCPEIDALVAELGLILGDLDGNGIVAFADFLILASNFGEEVDGYHQGDIDCSGVVAFADFLVLSANFGQTSSASLAAVPEPSSISALLVGLLCFASRLRPARRIAASRSRC